MGSKQWGLVAAQAISAGSFVMEYIGEVIPAAEAAERSAAYNAEEEKHTYFMHLSQHEVIDAKFKGNRARFINHSCQPNCETQKWIVDGEVCVCIFALRNISPGEELTYDYHLQCGGGKRVRCLCGAPECRGYLEADCADHRCASTAQDVLLKGPGLAGFAAESVLLAQPQQGAAYGSAAIKSATPRPALAHQVASGRQQVHAAQQATTPRQKSSHRHSPDSSATLTGSGRCSDASDLTSSHPSDLRKHQHKRIKLANAQPAAQQPEAIHHASAQCPPDPNLAQLDGLDLQPAQLMQRQAVSGDHPAQQRHSAAEDQIQGCHVLFQPTLSPPGARTRQGSVVQPVAVPAAPNIQQAPAYVQCTIAGLTPAQQSIKDREEQQLSQRLRHQQNMYTAGYQVDQLGAVQVPAGPYRRVISMKQVFAQRWQVEASAAQVADDAIPMQQLLLDGAVQLEKAPGQGAANLIETMSPDVSMQGPLNSEQPTASRGTSKLPIRLSNLKNAMRKAELGCPEVSSSTSSGMIGSGVRDDRHIVWQVGQLCNTPRLNDAWVEYYVDRFNVDFDSSYWSMLELLSADAC